MVVQLAFVRSADKVILVCARKRDSIDFIPKFLRNVFPQFPVEQYDEEPEKLKVTFRRNDFAYLVYKDFLLIVKQVGR